MEMRLLEYALEVYRKQSFTKAAESLHIAQPSLSKQIANLEKKLGVTLFYRGHKIVEPTIDGCRFVEQAEKILLMRDDLEREMQERKQGIGGELRIGSTAVTGGHILPPLLQLYNERYPNVSIRLIEESTEVLTDLTAKGLVDLSILSLPIEDSRLETKVIITEPLLLVLPREIKQWMPAALRNAVGYDSSSISKSKSISMADVSDSPFILLKKGYGFRHTVLELCAKNGFQTSIAYETSSIETAQALVMHGLGVTVIPKMVAHHNVSDSPLYVKIHANPTRTLVFAYNRARYLSVTARAFISIFEELKEKNSEYNVIDY